MSGSGTGTRTGTNTTIPTHYQILELPETASEQDIKRAFRRLSIKYHPDKPGGDAEKFKVIREAYNVLSDETQRRQYDLQRQFSSGGGMPGIPGIFRGMGGMGGIGGMPEVIFNMMRGMGHTGSMPHDMHSEDDIGGGGGGGGPQTSPQQFQFFVNGRPVNMGAGGSPGINIFGGDFGAFANTANAHIRRFMTPQPIVKQLELTMVQSYTGVTVPIEIDRVIISEAGERTTEKDTIYISVPEGIDHNEHITIKEKGHINVDKKGDIKIQILLNNDSIFRREGLDLVFRKTITLREALCGFKFELIGLDQKRYLIHNDGGKIITPGYRKEIPELGMRREGKKGNLQIVFEVEFPKELTAVQVERLADILP